VDTLWDFQQLDLTNTRFFILIVKVIIWFMKIGTLKNIIGISLNIIESGKGISFYIDDRKKPLKLKINSIFMVQAV